MQNLTKWLPFLGIIAMVMVLFRELSDGFDPLVVAWLVLALAGAVVYWYQRIREPVEDDDDTEPEQQ